MFKVKMKVYEEKGGASALNAATLKAASPRLDTLPHIETCPSSSI